MTHDSVGTRECAQPLSPHLPDLCTPDRLRAQPARADKCQRGEAAHKGQAGPHDQPRHGVAREKEAQTSPARVGLRSKAAWQGCAW